MSEIQPKCLYILRLALVLKKLGIARSTLYDWLNPKSPRYDDTFPKQFKIGARAVGWLEEEVDQWIALKIELSIGVVKVR